MEPVFDVVWPKSPRGVQRTPLAARLDGLNGARVAFLWDYVFRGDELFPALADHLRQRFPAVDVVDYPVFGNTHGSDEKHMIGALPDALRDRHIDAVVSGVGC